MDAVGTDNVCTHKPCKAVIDGQVGCYFELFSVIDLLDLLFFVAVEGAVKKSRSFQSIGNCISRQS
jgi:hypothetical protein